MKRLKRVIIVSLMLLFILPVSSVYAEIFDYANLLTDLQIKTLEERINTIESQYTIKTDGKSDKIGIYIITLPDKETIGADNFMTFDLSEVVYELLKYGRDTKKTGILLLLYMNEREVDIYTDGSVVHYTFTDYGKDALASIFLDNFAKDDWYTGFYHYLVQVEHQLMWAEKENFVGIMLLSTLLNFMTKNGSGTVSVVPASSEYTGNREDLDWYQSIGSIQTSSADNPPASIIVEVVLGYKTDDKAASTEITKRQIQIKNFLRQYFSSKSKSELKGVRNEEKLSMEIRNSINDDILQNSKIRDVLFLQLDVVE